MTNYFKPVFTITNRMAAGLTRIERARGFLEAAAHVQRRVREQYGEQETVSRSARRVLRSYLDWGVLQETGAKGIYSAGTTLDVEDSRLIAWLAEASLHARANGSALLKDLIDSPSFFPFRINPGHPNVLVQGRVNPGQDSVRGCKSTRPGRLSPFMPLN